VAAALPGSGNVLLLPAAAVDLSQVDRIPLALFGSASGEAALAALIAANTAAIATKADAGDVTASGLTMNSQRMLGRQTAAAGAVEEFVMEAGTFVPTFTFQTPGDLNVAYTTQLGIYQRLWRMVQFTIELVFTPTWTTSSGTARLAGIPYPMANDGAQRVFSIYPVSTLNWPAGTTHAVAVAAAGSSIITIASVGNAAGGASWGGTQFPTATARTLRLSGTYLTD
jgi:hypothetical protein